MEHGNSIKVNAIPALKDNYVWALVDETNKTVVIVDPGEAKPVLDFISSHGLKPLGILITHHHWDHVNGIGEIKKQFDIPVYGPATEDVPLTTALVRDNDVVTIPDFPVRFKAMYIPGHTKGHIAYHAPQMLFCGDTLFAAGCGRLFEGTPEQMTKSLGRMTALPDDTRIYCAHEYTLNNLAFAQTVEPDNANIKTRIEQVAALRDQGKPSLPSVLKEEKATNPFLRCDSRQLIENVEKYAGQTLGDPVSVFTWLRKWKDNF